MNRTEVSKLLAYVLRHNPAELGVELTADGWTDAQSLLERMQARRGIALSMEQLEALVAADSKGRYSLREGRIRANQGHSVDCLAVDETPLAPPPTLYHGTTRQRWEQIQKSGGLHRMARHHVHLSADADVAWLVGTRHKKETPLLLAVDAQRMHQDRHVFLQSENGVWLTASVPLHYLSVQAHVQ